MAGKSKVGRPYHVADIDLSYDPDLELYDNFFNACAGLRYFETVVLSRTLGVEARTVRNWKAGLTFPKRNGIASQVIRWVNDGKPQKIITQAQAATGMM